MENNLEEIDLYFTGSPSDIEKKEFNNRIQQDTSFASAVSFYLQAKNLAKIEQKNRLNEHHERLRKEKSNVRVIQFGGVFTAAAALVIGFFLFFSNGETSPQELGDTYLSENTRSLPLEMSSTKDSLNEGVNLYNEGKFKAASAAFAKLPTNALALEYRGLSELKANEYKEALVSFQKLAQNDAILNNKGLFYQGISYLKMGEKAKAITIFEQVKTQALFGKQEAEKILESLK